MIDRKWFEKEGRSFPEHTREYFHRGNPEELRRIPRYLRRAFGIRDDELERCEGDDESDESDDESGQDES